MAVIYLRIFVSRNANIDDGRVQLDLFTLRKILSPIEVKLASFRYLPRDFKSNYNDISCGISTPNEIALMSHNPDGFAYDGRLITIFYLGGIAKDSCFTRESNNPNNTFVKKFPLNNYVYLPIFEPRNPFLFSHEVVHCLFDRVENGVVNNEDPDPLAGERIHNAHKENLMYRDTPSSTNYLKDIQAPFPEGFFTIEQKRKAMGSQYVFDKFPI